MLLTIGLLTAMLVLSVGIIVLLGHLDLVFTTVPRGSTAFINKGDTMDAVFPNVESFRISKETDPEGRQWLVPVDLTKSKKEQKEEEINALFENSWWWTRWFQKLLWKSFGMRFMGWTVLNTRKHHFDIKTRVHLESSDEVGLKKRVRETAKEKGSVVDHLLHVVPRPMAITGITLPGDNSQISLLLLPIYKQVIPTVPVYTMGGDFFTQLDAAIEAHVVNCLNSYSEETKGRLTLEDWMALPKSGNHSILLKEVYRITGDEAYRETLPKDLQEYFDYLTHNQLVNGTSDRIPSGILPRFGFALSSLRLVAWEPYGETAGLVKAIQAKELEERMADGVRARANGERDADIARATGKAKLFGDPVKALTDLGVDKDIAADVLRTQIRTANLAGEHSKITTYIEGGSSASVMVSTK